MQYIFFGRAQYFRNNRERVALEWEIGRQCQNLKKMGDVPPRRGFGTSARSWNVVTQHCDVKKKIQPQYRPCGSMPGIIIGPEREGKRGSACITTGMYCRFRSELYHYVHVCMLLCFAQVILVLEFLFGNW